MQEINSEALRIHNVYSQRKVGDLYSIFKYNNLPSDQEKERKIIFLLKKGGINDLGSKKLLDIGCGGGRNLGTFLSWGADPKNLFGLDILEERIAIAKQMYPNIDFKYGDASNLENIQDNTFDIVCQSTVFTSVLDQSIREKIAKEMVRVLKPDGVILWYDFRYNNPKNKEVKKVTKKEIKQLFQNCSISLKRCTLAPPIARKISILGWWTYSWFNFFPFLRTHYCGVFVKNK